MKLPITILSFLFCFLTIVSISSICRRFDRLERAAGLSRTSTDGHSTNVHWMGHPMFFDYDGVNGNLHWADDVELGCAGDGRMIWRRTGFASNSPRVEVVIPFNKTNASSEAQLDRTK